MRPPNGTIRKKGRKLNTEYSRRRDTLQCGFSDVAYATVALPRIAVFGKLGERLGNELKCKSDLEENTF
jgi:hypothetical protein